MRNVPSFIGKVPHEWTEAVITKLRQFNVSWSDIRAAFKITRAKGMDFEVPMGYGDGVWMIFPKPPLPAYKPPAPYTPPTIGNVHPNQWSPFWVEQVLGKMEDQYVKALLNADPHLIEILAGAFYLFWTYVEARMGDKKTKSEVAFTQEWDQSVNEAFQEARNLKTNVLILTRLDLRRLRQVDHPDFESLVRLRMPWLVRAGEEEGEGEGD